MTVCALVTATAATSESRTAVNLAMAGTLSPEVYCCKRGDFVGRSRPLLLDSTRYRRWDDSHAGVFQKRRKQAMRNA